MLSRQMQPQPEQHHYHGSPVQHQPQQEVQQPAADTPQEQQQPLQQHGEEETPALQQQQQQQQQQLEQALATLLTQHGITLPPIPSLAPLLAPYVGLLPADRALQLAAPVVARYMARRATGRKAASADASVLFGPLKKQLVQHLSNKAQGKAEVVGLLRLVHTLVTMCEKDVAGAAHLTQQLQHSAARHHPWQQQQQPAGEKREQQQQQQQQAGEGIEEHSQQQQQQQQQVLAPTPPSAAVPVISAHGQTLQQVADQLQALALAGSYAAVVRGVDTGDTQQLTQLLLRGREVLEVPCVPVQYRYAAAGVVEGVDTGMEGGGGKPASSLRIQGGMLVVEVSWCIQVALLLRALEAAGAHGVRLETEEDWACWATAVRYHCRRGEDLCVYVQEGGPQETVALRKHLAQRVPPPSASRGWGSSSSSSRRKPPAGDNPHNHSSSSSKGSRREGQGCETEVVHTPEDRAVCSNSASSSCNGLQLPPAVHHLSSFTHLYPPLPQQQQHQQQEVGHPGDPSHLVSHVWGQMRAKGAAKEYPWCACNLAAAAAFLQQPGQPVSLMGLVLLDQLLGRAVRRHQQGGLARAGFVPGIGAGEPAAAAATATAAASTNSSSSSNRQDDGVGGSKQQGELGAPAAAVHKRPRQQQPGEEEEMMQRCKQMKQQGAFQEQREEEHKEEDEQQQQEQVHEQQEEEQQQMEEGAWQQQQQQQHEEPEEEGSRQQQQQEEMEDQEEGGLPWPPLSPAHPWASTSIGAVLPALIMSGPLTSTQWHVEQLLLGAFNILLWGAPKLWLIMPTQATWAAFTASPGATPDGSPFNLRRFLDKNYSFQELSLPEMLRVGAVPVVQHPGDLLVTLPGWSAHGTVSAGPSIALASNTYWGRDVVQHLIQAARAVAHPITFSQQQPQQQQQNKKRRPPLPPPPPQQQQRQQKHRMDAGPRCSRSSGIHMIDSESCVTGVTSVTHRFTRVTMLEQHWKILGAMGPPGVGAGVEEVGLLQRLGASQQQLAQLQQVVEAWHYPTPGELQEGFAAAAAAAAGY